MNEETNNASNREEQVPAVEAPTAPAADVAEAAAEGLPPDTAAAVSDAGEPVTPDADGRAADAAGCAGDGNAAAASSRWRGIARSLGAGVAFVLVGLLLLYGASRVFEPKSNGNVGGVKAAHVAANGFLGEAEDSLDALFIGDSETYSAVSPVEIWKDSGAAAYTCAIGGQNLTYSRTLLERALSVQKPKVVMVEGNSLFRAFDENKLLKSTIKDMFPIFERHDRWKALTPKDFLGQTENDHVDDMKGFRMKWAQNPANASGYMEPTEESAEVPDLTKSVLAEMRDMCRAAGGELVVVATPSTKCWSTARHNGAQAAADELGIDFIDLNTGDDAVAIDWDADTRDAGDHLNYYGAVKTSRALADILHERYGAADHRGDAAYAKDWGRAVRHHDRLVEKGPALVPAGRPGAIAMVELPPLYYPASASGESAPAAAALALRSLGSAGAAALAGE